MQRLELKIPPVAVFLIFGAAMWLATKQWPQGAFDLPGAYIVAAILVVISAAFGIPAILAFRRHETTVHPNRPDKSSTIVTVGVYRYTRNPMYLALALVLLAWAVGLGNLVAVAFVPMFVAYLTRFQIIPEERTLLSSFGDPFAEYMNSVRRWI